MGCKHTKDGIRYKMVLLRIQRVLVRKERKELAEKLEKITGKKVVLQKIRDFVEEKEEMKKEGNISEKDKRKERRTEIKFGNNAKNRNVRKGKESKQRRKIQRRKRFHDEDNIVIERQEGFCALNKANDWSVNKHNYLKKQMMMITPLKRNNDYIREDGNNSNNMSNSNNNSNCNCISNEQTTDKSTNTKKQTKSTRNNNFSINNNKLNISTFPNINITTTTNINTIKYTPPNQQKYLIHKRQVISTLKKQLPFEESIETE